MCHCRRRLAASEVQIQFHALVYNLADFLRTLAPPAEVKQRSLTTLRIRMVKIGAEIVRHERSVTSQLAEVTMPRALFQHILGAIAAFRPMLTVRFRGLASSAAGLHWCPQGTCAPCCRIDQDCCTQNAH